MSDEQEWVCVVCLRPVTAREKPDAAQIELQVEGAGTLYFMRHGGCEMDDAARMRLARAGRERRTP